MNNNVFSKSKLGPGRKSSFSSLLRVAQQGDLSSSLNGDISFEHSYRNLNTRKYKEEMKKNRVKVKIRNK